MKKNLLQYLFLIALSLFFVSCSESDVDDADTTPDQEQEADSQTDTDPEDEADSEDEVDPEPEVETVPSTYLPLIHSQASIANMAAVIEAADPDSEAYKCYLYFKSHAEAQSSYSYPSADEGGEYVYGNSSFRSHFDAAHMNGIMYAVTGDEAHAECAAGIILAYINCLALVEPSSFNTNTCLNVGIGYHIVCAYNFLKDYGTFYDDNFEAFELFLRRTFLNGANYFYYVYDPYTNGNWGMSVTNTYLTIAAFLGDDEMYEDAIEKFLYRYDNGSLYYYLDRETGQCQETGRDQGHVQFGLSRAVAACEVAWNRGDDLYGEFDNVIYKGFEYTAKVLLNALKGTNYDVPYTQWTDITGKYCGWASINAGAGDDNNYYRPCWATAYNHYVNRLGMEMPYTKELLEYSEWGKNTLYNNYDFYDGTWFEIFQFNAEHM